MATTLTPYPPIHPHTTTRIPPSLALSHLQHYLTASETTPHLHPDALLDPRGLKFSTTGGPSGGLTLHSLRRVERGLAGEVLAPEAGELDELFPVHDVEDLQLRGVEAGARRGGLKRERAASAYEGVETEDPVQWARKQTVVEGEVGDRDPADGTEVMDVDVDVVMGEEGEEDVGGGAAAGAMSQREKEARKEEKKRRKKEEKKERAEKRANK